MKLEYDYGLWILDCDITFLDWKIWDNFSLNTNRVLLHTQMKNLEVYFIFLCPNTDESQLLMLRNNVKNVLLIRRSTKNKAELSLDLVFDWVYCGMLSCPHGSLLSEGLVFKFRLTSLVVKKWDINKLQTNLLSFFSNIQYLAVSSSILMNW